VTIQEFATKYRLKTESEAEGEKIIPSGPRRFHACHIFQHSDDGSVFGLILAGLGSGELPRGYVLRQEGHLAPLGATISQRGDNEAVFLFDPTNERLTGAILRAGKIRRRRLVKLTEEQKVKLRERLERGRARKTSAA
jgi:hypothetical protein